MAGAIDMFGALRSIEQRFALIDQGKPLPDSSGTAVKLVEFTLLGSQFLVPLDEIGEIITPPHSTPLPRVQPWLTGIANLRGRLLTLVDFAAFLGFESKPSPLQKTILVELRGLYVGLLVDRVAGIRTIGMENYGLAEKSSPLQPYCDGWFNYRATSERGDYNAQSGAELRQLPVFRPYRLLDDERFLQVLA